MKVFHKEGGKETVHVQMQDIMYLMSETDIPIPATIVEKVFARGTVIVNDANRFDFVMFDEPHLVKFFKEQDFIIDFDQYKDLSDMDFQKKYNELVTRANAIAENWNGMTQEQRQENASLYTEHQNLVYMINFVGEIYMVLHGKRKMPFPDFVTIPKRRKRTSILPFWKWITM